MVTFDFNIFFRARIKLTKSCAIIVFQCVKPELCFSSCLQGTSWHQTDWKAELGAVLSGHVSDSAEGHQRCRPSIHSHSRHDPPLRKDCIIRSSESCIRPLWALLHFSLSIFVEMLFFHLHEPWFFCIFLRVCMASASCNSYQYLYFWNSRKLAVIWHQNSR